MKIPLILASDKISLSVEMFPPKQWSGVESTVETAREMARFSPSFVSVTYGAGGGTRDYTVAVASAIEKMGTPALAHLTAVSTSRDSLPALLNSFLNAGITNILALRGDAPADPNFVPCRDFPHASDLARAISEFGGFSIGGACYPEKHPEAPFIYDDIENLRKKTDAGCEFLTTQMFFDNDKFYTFRDRLSAANINVPVAAGIMPVTNAKQIDRILHLSDCSLPRRFTAIAERFADHPDAMYQAGILYACSQILDLIANDVHNIHIYSMNKPLVAEAIVRGLQGIL